jgi:hypothetical protein
MPGDWAKAGMDRATIAPKTQKCFGGIFSTNLRILKKVIFHAFREKLLILDSAVLPGFITPARARAQPSRSDTSQYNELCLLAHDRPFASARL